MGNISHILLISIFLFFTQTLGFHEPSNGLVEPLTIDEEEKLINEIEVPFESTEDQLTEAEESFTEISLERTSSHQTTTEEESPENTSESDSSVKLTTPEATIPESNADKNQTTQSTTSTEVSSTTEETSSTTISTRSPNEDENESENTAYCPCDLHEASCDMNCCCDIDCNEIDGSFFTNCENNVAHVRDSRSYERRQRSCFKSFSVFKALETEIVKKTDKGMLCLIRDNNRGDNILPTSKIKEITKKILTGKLKIVGKYSSNMDREMEYELKAYKFGSPILGFKSDTPSNFKKLIPLAFPAPFRGSTCEGTWQPVTFLEDFQSKCLVNLIDVEKDCEQKNILNVNFLLDRVVPIANPAEEPVKLTPIFRLNVCNGDMCSSNSSDDNAFEFPKPSYSTKKQMCQNVLTKLYIKVHYELKGIKEITAEAVLQDFSPGTKKFYQLYDIQFLYGNRTDSAKRLNEKSWPRSGNPGYIVGKPVIMGEEVKVENWTENPSTTENPTKATKVFVDVNRDPNRWMTLNAPGICDPEQRSSVLFDYSKLSICSINITSFQYCHELQEAISKILLGVPDTRTFHTRKWRVAAFGNPRPTQLSEWVPVSFKNFPLDYSSKGRRSLVSKGCENIIASIHIYVAYAFVGQIDFPQPKITGVMYEYGEPFSFYAGYHSELFMVSSTANFVDVTGPAVTRVAKWPVLSIKLPKDFFYPFSSM